MSIPVAVYPPRGQIVHLYLPEYRPGTKARSVKVTGMCGASVNHTTPPPVGPSPTGRVHVALHEAIHYEHPAPADAADPRPPRFWSWCAPCLGRAVQHYDLADIVLKQILRIADLNDGEKP